MSDAEISVKVHLVADGLPDMDSLVGQVAYIWDGAVVSGWPLLPHSADVSGSLGLPIVAAYLAGEPLWEPSEDRHGGPVAGVKVWLEFPVPTWEIGT